MFVRVDMGGWMTRCGVEAAVLEVGGEGGGGDARWAPVAPSPGEGTAEEDGVSEEPRDLVVQEPAWRDGDETPTLSHTLFLLAPAHLSTPTWST